MVHAKALHSEEKRRVDPLVLMASHESVVHEDSELLLCPLKRHMSMKELLFLFSMSFSFALCFNTLNNILIPKSVARLGGKRQGLWLSLLMTLGAFCQMSIPLVGAYSDRLGSRTIFLVYGSVLTVVGLFLFILLELMDMMIILCLAQVISTVGLSVIYSMVTVLLNDYVLEEQTGKGSGAMALLALTGSGTGYAMLALDVPVTYCLCTYILATLLCLAITMFYTPIVEINRPLQQSIRFCDVVKAALTVPSFRVFPDFFLACGGRALFNAGLSSQVYLVYFVRDVLRSSIPVRITSALFIAALLGGFLGAFPSGVFSDHIGRKPVIYGALSLCVMSLVLLLFIRDVELLYVMGFIHGVGSASYLSVDYALGILTLPRKCGLPIDAAKDLGLFAISATIGTFFGQVIYGAVLNEFVERTETGEVRFSYFGFVVIYSIASLAFIASSATLAPIRLK